MKHAFSLIAFLAAAPALAEETRHMDAHEHGVGTLDIAIEGTTVAMELHAPGADIVGFEYAAKSDEDLTKVDAGLALLKEPLALFALSDDAKCSVVEAKAELESGAHDHDEHEEGHDDHKHDGHEEGHDDHKDDHAEHEDNHDDHEEHADESGHSEFHAEYMLECANPAAIEDIAFPYFAIFPNAQEVEVQLVSSSGAHASEVERDAPLLKLEH